MILHSLPIVIQQIQAKYNNKLPVVVGGSGFNNRDHYLNSTSSAFLMKEASFDDIMKLVKESIK